MQKQMLVESKHKWQNRSIRSIQRENSLPKHIQKVHLEQSVTMIFIWIRFVVIINIDRPRGILYPLSLSFFLKFLKIESAWRFKKNPVKKIGVPIENRIFNDEEKQKIIIVIGYRWENERIKDNSSDKCDKLTFLQRSNMHWANKR